MEQSSGNISKDNHTLLVKINVEMEYMKTGLNKLEDSIAAAFTELKSFVKDDRERVDAMKKDFEAKYVTKDEYSLIKGLVYGFCGIILTAVVGALVGLVILSHQPDIGSLDTRSGGYNMEQPSNPRGSSPIPR